MKATDATTDTGRSEPISPALAAPRAPGGPERPAAVEGPSAAARFTKRFLDITVSAVLLVATSPLCALIALVVRIDDGAVFFRQRRVGREGRMIKVTKFRTMALDAEDQLLADPSLHARYVANGFKLRVDEDPRISRWGRFLRSSSLDELPQLWNVLRGDMSMVGPRPVVVPELVEYVNRDAEAAYLSNRPGLTGLWQVSGRSDLDYDQRVALDLAYLERPGPLRDLRIIANTALVVVRRVGAH